MLKRAVLCEHTHTHTSLSKEVTKRSLLWEGWCHELASLMRGDVL